MTDPIGPGQVFNEILRVLQRIDAKLDGHEERFRSLERNTRNGWAHIGQVPSRSSTLQSVEPEFVTIDDVRPSRKGTPANEDTIDDVRGPLKVLYGQWGINQMDQLLHLALSRSLMERLRGCWLLPDDNRLPLNFVKSNVMRTNAPWGPPTESYPRIRRPVEKELDFLCQFDQKLRVQPGNDFVVIDFDEADNTRIYRIGDEAIGPELEVQAQGSPSAPWSRLILYQGATTGDSINPKTRGPRQAIPYFTSADKILGLWEHLDYHLQTKRRSTMTNPYARIWNGFHTNFYEIREVTHWQVKELWKHGPLYGHPLGWHFRKCAYTIYAAMSTDEVGVLNPEFGRFNRHWTLLVLAPDSFFDEKNTSFPMNSSSLGRAQNIGYHLCRLNQPGAELHFVGQGLERITARWADFLSYFDYILDGGDSLMKPTEHDNLLFDDGAFSRSRRYFWAIDCLSEFELSITDNITQWELYKAARLPPLEKLTELDHRQLAFAERQYRVLQNQRESFRQKLASTKALRDALFNASAVIESRASTTLGENIKLLTFVSIFFLPLAFTTSLWSVNDKFSINALTYVIVIVALVTYFVMFNINSLFNGFSKVYELKKKHVVRAMKNDPDEAWKQRGRRFEVFRPKHENPQPSEWYIALYALVHPIAMFGIYRASTTHKHSSIPHSSGSPGIANIFRRRIVQVEDEVENEEPWVIESKKL